MEAQEVCIVIGLSSHSRRRQSQESTQGLPLPDLSPHTMQMHSDTSSVAAGLPSPYKPWAGMRHTHAIFFVLRPICEA